jgi:tRNA (guanine-N7-)-methyltransferase
MRNGKRANSPAPNSAASYFRFPVFGFTFVFRRPTGGDKRGMELWRFIFANDHPVEIEIGPGTGTFILPAASARPQINFLGIEHSRGRAWRLQSAIETKAIRNALVINADAACVVGALLPADSVAAYHIYFPDPWWKRRHHRRRLFTPAFAAALARTLVPGGRLYLATDVEEVLQLSLCALDQCRAFVRDERTRSQRLGLTAFERKGIARGATIHEATLVRNGSSPHPHPSPS